MRTSTVLTPEEEARCNRIAYVILEMKHRTLADLRSYRRDAPTALARHMLYYSLRKFTGYSWPVIGGFIRRDHTSAISGDRYLKRENPALAARIDSIIEAVVEPEYRVPVAPNSGRVRTMNGNYESPEGWLNRLGLN